MSPPVSIKFGVVVFPGSNCDHDCYFVLKHLFSAPVEFIWHQETSLSRFDVIILPGGFSYGDYLRCGAIARFSPIMRPIEQFAKNGGLVLGICNGFQILLESGLLPGAMQRNKNLKFICKDVYVRVENNRTPFTQNYPAGKTLRLPIAHAEGNYYVDSKTLKTMEANGQVVLRYCSENGTLDSRTNPNGSVGHIAGICNPEGNVMGMMPHPERSCDPVLNNEDGRLFFDSLIQKEGMPR